MRSKVTYKSLLQLLLAISIILWHDFTPLQYLWWQLVQNRPLYIAEVSYMGEFYMSKPLNFDVV